MPTIIDPFGTRIPLGSGLLGPARKQRPNTRPSDTWHAGYRGIGGEYLLQDAEGVPIAFDTPQACREWISYIDKVVGLRGGQTFSLEPKHCPGGSEFERVREGGAVSPVRVSSISRR